MEPPSKIDSHIVPETYLKHFADASNMLWQHKIKSKYQTKIRQVSTSQVCYEENYFRIQTDFTLKSLGLQDKDYVEKEAFKEYENSYNEILGQIISNKEFILTKDASIFLDTLLSIKSRNRAHRKYFKKADLEKFLERDLKGIKENWHLFQDIVKSDFDTMANQIRDDFLNQEGVEDDLFLRSFIEKDGKVKRAINEVKSFLSNSAWYLLVSDLNNPFITSDNPGFCVDDKDAMRNTRFSGNFMFFFPLTPSLCFMACNKLYDTENNAITKRLHYKMADSLAVDKINRCTIVNCNEKIFSNKKIALEKYLAKMNLLNPK